MKTKRKTTRRPVRAQRKAVAKIKKQAMRVHARVMAMLAKRTAKSDFPQPKTAHVQKFRPPALPPGVRENFIYKNIEDPGQLGEPVLALDDADNAPMWAFLNAQQCGLGFPGYGYLAELTQKTEYRSPVETIATEVTREWLDITVDGKASKKKRKARGEDVDANANGVPDALDDKVQKIEERFEELKVREHFRKLSEVDGFFGRAQLFIDCRTDGGDPDRENQLPLVADKETIRPGMLRGLKVVEPIWTSPYSYNSTDPTRPDFYKPRAWFVMGKRVHASRLLTFVSREVPDMLKPAYNFGGLSLSQLMDPYVYQWIRARNAVAQLIFNFSILVLATNMATVLQQDCDEEDAQGLLDRMQLFINSRDNQGLMALDKNTEELKSVTVSLANLDKLMAQFQEHMAAPSHMPLVKLTGITPAGLNADSEGEIQVWYDGCRAYQTFFYGQHMKRVLDIVQLDLYGEIDPAITWTWCPLATPSKKEAAEIRKLDSETDGNNIGNGVISSQEVRDRITKDPDSGYNNLSGEAPPPPQQLDAEHGAELDETGKVKDHARGEESADNAHERTLEAQEKQAKLDKQAGGPKK